MVARHSLVEVDALASRTALMGEGTAVRGQGTPPSHRAKISRAGLLRGRPRGWARLGARSAQQTEAATTASGTWRLTPDYEIFSRDALRVLEAGVVGAAALGAAALLARLGQAEGAGGSVTMLATIAAALSPFVLRGGRATRDDRAPDAAIPSDAAVLLPPLTALFALVALIGAAAVPGGFPPAGLLLVWAALAFAGLWTTRALFRAHLATLRRRGALRERVGVVWCDDGAEPSPERLAALRPGAEVVGLFQVGNGSSNHPGIEALIRLGRDTPIDRVLVVSAHLAAERLRTIACQLRALDVDVDLLCVDPRAPGGAEGTALRLSLVRRPLRGWDGVLKAIEDRAIALLILPLALPLMALIALAIRLDSPGPVLFRQNRHGRNNAEFQILKFRTMRWQGAALATGARQTARNDARVTRVGGFLRATSLDELPQLLNVLRGDMSIVGPRPHPVMMRTENRLGHEITPDYAQRHRVKPGLTGLAQVNGSRGAMETVEQLHHRVEHDLRYIDNWSLALDLGILVVTPIRLLWNGGKAF